MAPARRPSSSPARVHQPPRAHGGASQGSGCDELLLIAKTLGLPPLAQPSSSAALMAQITLAWNEGKLRKAIQDGRGASLCPVLVYAAFQLIDPSNAGAMPAQRRGNVGTLSRSVVLKALCDYALAFTAQPHPKPLTPTRCSKPCVTPRTCARCCSCSRPSSRRRVCAWSSRRPAGRSSVRAPNRSRSPSSRRTLCPHHSSGASPACPSGCSLAYLSAWFRASRSMSSRPMPAWSAAPSPPPPPEPRSALAASYRSGTRLRRRQYKQCGVLERERWLRRRRPPTLAPTPAHGLRAAKWAWSKWASNLMTPLRRQPHP